MTKKEFANRIKLNENTIKNWEEDINKKELITIINRSLITESINKLQSDEYFDEEKNLTYLIDNVLNENQDKFYIEKDIKLAVNRNEKKLIEEIEIEKEKVLKSNEKIISNSLKLIDSYKDKKTNTENIIEKEILQHTIDKNNKMIEEIKNICDYYFDFIYTNNKFEIIDEEQITNKNIENLKNSIYEMLEKIKK